MKPSQQIEEQEPNKQEANSGETPSEQHPPGFPEIQLSFRLPESLLYVTQMRRASRAFMLNIGVAQQDLEDAELILGELATNAIRHAQGDDYQVSIELLQDQMVITVTDNGTGFPEVSLPEPGTLRSDGLTSVGADGEEQTRFGGFGLPLLHALADEIDIRPNKPQGTIISATKHLRIDTFNGESRGE